MVLKEKKYQMDPNTNMDKKDVLCAVFLWLFLVLDVLVVMLFCEQNQEAEDDIQNDYSNLR